MLNNVVPTAAGYGTRITLTKAVLPAAVVERINQLQGKRTATPGERKALAKKAAKDKDEAASPWSDYAALTEIFIPGSDDDIDTLAANYAAAHQDEKKAKADKERIGGQLESACMLAEVERLLTTKGDLRVRRITSHQPSRISKEKLLDAGVDLETVESCTVPGVEYSYVQIDKMEE